MEPDQPCFEHCSRRFWSIFGFKLSVLLPVVKKHLDAITSDEQGKREYTFTWDKLPWDSCKLILTRHDENACLEAFFCTYILLAGGELKVQGSKARPSIFQVRDEYSEVLRRELFTPLREAYKLFWMLMPETAPEEKVVAHCMGPLSGDVHPQTLNEGWLGVQRGSFLGPQGLVRMLFDAELPVDWSQPSGTTQQASLLWAKHPPSFIEGAPIELRALGTHKVMDKQSTWHDLTQESNLVAKTTLAPMFRGGSNLWDIMVLSAEVVQAKGATTLLPVIQPRALPPKVGEELKTVDALARGSLTMKTATSGGLQFNAATSKRRSLEEALTWFFFGGRYDVEQSNQHVSVWYVDEGIPSPSNLSGNPVLAMRSKWDVAWESTHWPLVFGERYLLGIPLARCKVVEAKSYDSGFLVSYSNNLTSGSYEFNLHEADVFDILYARNRGMTNLCACLSDQGAAWQRPHPLMPGPSGPSRQVQGVNHFPSIRMVQLDNQGNTTTEHTDVVREVFKQLLLETNKTDRRYQRRVSLVEHASLVSSTYEDVARMDLVLATNKAPLGEATLATLRKQATDLRDTLSKALMVNAPMSLEKKKINANGVLLELVKSSLDKITPVNSSEQDVRIAVHEMMASLWGNDCLATLPPSSNARTTRPPLWMMTTNPYQQDTQWLELLKNQPSVAGFIPLTDRHRRNHLLFAIRRVVERAAQRVCRLRKKHVEAVRLGKHDYEFNEQAFVVLETIHFLDRFGPFLLNILQAHKARKSEDSLELLLRRWEPRFLGAMI